MDSVDSNEQHDDQHLSNAQVDLVSRVDCAEECHTHVKPERPRSVRTKV